MKYQVPILLLLMTPVFALAVFGEKILPASVHLYTASRATVVEASEKPQESPEALRAFLVSKGALELSEHATELMELPRWKEALAIVGKETSWCTRGVGESRNNCGAVKSSIPGRTFKIYENVYDAVWDVSYLLQKPRYKDLDIESMNGVYCVDESRVGQKCALWSEHINDFLEEIEQAVTAEVEVVAEV